MIAQLVLFTGLRCSGTSSVAAALVGSGAGVLRRPRWPATAAALHLGPASCGKQPSATPWTPAGTVLGVRGYAKGGRGQLPDEGPPKAVTVALPFAITREQADAAFKAFHSRHWLQNPSLPRWRRAAKEVRLPVARGSVCGPASLAHSPHHPTLPARSYPPPLPELLAVLGGRRQRAGRGAERRAGAR